MGDTTLGVFSFAVEDRPELGLIVYNPVSPDDAAKVEALVDGARD